jgi:hypothetical protein
MPDNIQTALFTMFRRMMALNSTWIKVVQNIKSSRGQTFDPSPGKE